MVLSLQASLVLAESGLSIVTEYNNLPFPHHYQTYMNLTKDDQDFIYAAANVLPVENVDQSNLKGSFHSFRGGQRLFLSEDKACFAKQVKALKNSKEELKNLPYAVKLSKISHTGSNDTHSSHSKIISFVSNGKIHLRVDSSLNSDSGKCDSQSKEQILAAIDQAIVEEEARLKALNKSKNDSKEILADLLADETCNP